MNVILIALFLSQLSLVAMNGLHLWAEYNYALQRPVAASAIYPWNDKYLFMQAMLDLKAGQNQWAVKDLKKLLELSPYNIDAVNDLGVAYWLLDDKEEAARWFKKALSMAPSYHWAQDNLDVMEGRKEGEINIMVMAK